VFGGRLAELPSDLAGIEFRICGRDLAKAKAPHFGLIVAYRGALDPSPRA
jgi:hypothetical protein